MRPNIAIILAGGIGSRMGLDMPKQFFKVAGKMVIEHTIEAFERNPHIAEAAIVSNPAHVTDIENIVQRNGWTKVKQILKGGKERYDSSLAAIRAYSGRDINLIFHDAVRPLVSQRIINDVCYALQEHEIVNVTLPAVDTIIEVEDGRMVATPDRSRLHCVQTPQGFRLNAIELAYDRALKDPSFRATDDCGVAFRYLPEVPIHLVSGEEINVKMTYKEDIPVLEKLLSLRNDTGTTP